MTLNPLLLFSLTFVCSVNHSLIHLFVRSFFYSLLFCSFIHVLSFSLTFSLFTSCFLSFSLSLFLSFFFLFFRVIKNRTLRTLKYEFRSLSRCTIYLLVILNPNTFPLAICSVYMKQKILHRVLKDIHSLVRYFLTCRGIEISYL